ncbi:GntR family transcriptional regulator [Peribacillus cavernae]|uniref:GntR family transcriptional regulator n=1 Tax=Peribacillus cavernae TaxID=1674310 RepID=A0A433HL21_9BACI|nr:GntR family transcriptional regulator [Peribacillus cavernae]MDQ0221158.1 DNA-binding GntR family transcriptional regulator [Peribacillus cavernae]RUQ29086.1 GntR family transcriptional regulator [Peribacillus cavernae]
MIREKERGETTEYVYNLLKEMIFGWRLSPGQKINISHLTREINISAIPLREALSRLHSERLVVSEPNKGYRVSDTLDDDSMTKMLEARILMETHAVRNIIRSNHLSVTEEMSRLTEQMSSINVVSSNKEGLHFTHLDQQFHYSMMNRGENSFLSEAYEGMHCHLHIGRFYHLKGIVDQRETTAEHWEIIEAIRTRDTYRAERAIANHIQDAKSRLLERDKKENR